MVLLIAGLVLFIGVHLVPTLPDLRSGLTQRLGARGYLAAFSLVSAAALVSVVVGFGQMQGLGRGNPQLWTPPNWTRHVTYLLMLPAIILLVAAYVPSRIRTAVGHPMLTALMLWAFAHLLANGDLASVLLFGSFLAYAVYDRISVTGRTSLGPVGTAPGRAAFDVVAVAAGLAIYALILLRAHAWIAGVPLLP